MLLPDEWFVVVVHPGLNAPQQVHVVIIAIVTTSGINGLNFLLYF